MDSDEAPRVFTGRLELVAEGAGWGVWRVTQVAPPLVVGSITLSQQPDGTVELAHSMDPKWARKGYATEALGALIDWCFSHPEVRRIIAHVSAGQPASLRVLAQNGLSPVGPGPTPNTLRFELRRPD